MKDVTDIFLISKEGLLEINKIEARTVKEFRTILIRDRGKQIEGDYDGRRKWFAFRELMYIYLYHHPASMYRDLPDEIRHEKCIEHAELPDNWKVDKVINLAADKFLSLVGMTALHHSYINANKGVYSLGEDLKFFNNLRDKIRNKIKDKTLQLEDTIDEENVQKLTAEIDSSTLRLMDMGTKINAISNALPLAFDTVEKLKIKLLKESQGGGKLYGGGELNNRER